jgi:hypothetical protein
VPHIAFAGARDTTVPVATIRGAVEKLGPNAVAQLIVMPDFDHDCCWVRDWPTLRDQALRDRAWKLTFPGS